MAKAPRWRDSEDEYRDDPPHEHAPRIVKPKARKAPQPARTDSRDNYDRPRLSLKKAITQMIDADPDRRPQSISDELERMGYEAPVNTIYYVRAEYLGLPTYSGKGEPIIKRTAPSARPTRNKRLPPVRR